MSAIQAGVPSALAQAFLAPTALVAWADTTPPTNGRHVSNNCTNDPLSAGCDGMTDEME